jgi:hypothetical protein
MCHSLRSDGLRLRVNSQVQEVFDGGSAGLRSLGGARGVVSLIRSAGRFTAESLWCASVSPWLIVSGGGFFVLQLLRALKHAAVHHYVGVAGLNQVRGSGDFTAGRTRQRDLHHPAFGKIRARFSQGAARSRNRSCIGPLVAPTSLMFGIPVSIARLSDCRSDISDSVT